MTTRKQVSHISLGRRMDAIPHKVVSWRCPYCGLVHRKTWFRIYAGGLWALGALIWLFAPKAQASANPIPKRSGQHAVIIERQIQAPPALTITPTPTATVEFALRTPPSPTPLPIPKTGVIWAQTSARVYLYEEPGKEMLGDIPNGQFVHLLDEFAAYGNLPWTQITFAGQTGWVEATKVFRLRFEGETFYNVSAPEGSYLYTAPHGQRIVWLPEGTPLHFEQANEGWIEVSTLHGQTGWILSENIAPPGEDLN